MSDFVLMHIATRSPILASFAGTELTVGAQDIELRLNAAHKKGDKYTKGKCSRLLPLLNAAVDRTYPAPISRSVASLEFDCRTHDSTQHQNARNSNKSVHNVMRIVG